MRAHLTDVSVRALKPADKQYRVWDTKTPAFGVTVNGRTKSWIVMYGPKRVLKVLGRYSDLSLSDARRKAHVYLGKQPEQTKAPRFSEALKEFLEQHYADKRPRVKSEAKRHLEKHFLPVFGPWILTTITDGEIGRQLATLSHVPSEQLHAFRILRTMLRWCTRPPRRYIPHSPLEGYEAPSQDRKRKRILTDDELTKVWHAAAAHTRGGMVQLLILWGARNGEVARIRRSWIENGVLTIRGEFTKNHRDHAIPLLPMALTILEAQPNTGDHFFQGHWDCETHFQDGSWGKLRSEIADSSSVKDWQMRDIRRTFRSNMPKIGVPRDLAERLVNHVSGTRNELDEIYDRYDYIDEKREALRKWEARVAALVLRQKAAA
jgi:Arm DNA-binding domain/Phage integrase family